MSYRVLIALATRILRAVLLEGVADLEFDAFWPCDASLTSIRLRSLAAYD